MGKVTVTLPSWIDKEEVMRNLRAHALLKMEFYRSRMKPFEVKYATTLPRFRRRVEKSAEEDFAAWDDLMEWEAYYQAYQEWKKRHSELRRRR
jgi:hypothetical protein